METPTGPRLTRPLVGGGLRLVVMSLGCDEGRIPEVREEAKSSTPLGPGVSRTGTGLRPHTPPLSESPVRRPRGSCPLVRPVTPSDVGNGATVWECTHVCRGDVRWESTNMGLRLTYGLGRYGTYL